jgi:carbonic anhydrase
VLDDSFEDPDHASGRFAEGVFDDLLDGNRRYRAWFGLGGLAPHAARELALVTCMDSRIEPLAMLGIGPGDAKITRNAGARVTDDVLRSLVLATNLLGVTRVAVVQHTDCAMTKASNDELAARITRRAGVDAGSWGFLTIADQEATLRADVQRVRDCPLIPAGVVAAGFVYDVSTGALRPVA